jgi:hypothetical protein
MGRASDTGKIERPGTRRIQPAPPTTRRLQPPQGPPTTRRMATLDDLRKRLKKK